MPPPPLHSGTTFKSLGTSPFEAYNALPDNGKWQLVLAIGLIEISDAHSETLFLRKAGPTDGSFGALTGGVGALSTGRT